MKARIKLKAKSLLLSAMLTVPVCALADDFYTSELSNNSKIAEGYYLVQDKVWSDNGCVADSGKQRLNPGDTTTLKIKKDCKWGGVQYVIHKIKGDASMGHLGHSFRDGIFSVDMTDKCNGDKCVFRDLSPKQNQ